MKVRIISGVANARRMASGSSDENPVVVTDGNTMVLLTVGGGYAAGLSPDQAKAVAEQLIASADRVSREDEAKE